LDYILVALHILLGYVDLITDCLAINELFKAGREEVAGINIAFLLLNSMLDIYFAKKTPQRMLSRLFQLHDFVEGYKVFITGHQTQTFVASKRIDAIIRSLPSMILQLYSFFLTIDTISSAGSATLIASVCLSIAGMATMLASLSPIAGENLLSTQMVYLVFYYSNEITVRALLVTLIFASIRGIGFVVILLDYVIRAYTLRYFKNGDYILQAVMWSGSDNYLEDDVYWLIGSILTAVELFVFLLVINLLPTTTMHDMRKYSVAQAVSIISCLGVLFKTAAKYYIDYYLFVMDIRDSSFSSTPSPMPSQIIASNSQATSANNITDLELAKAIVETEDVQIAKKAFYRSKELVNINTQREQLLRIIENLNKSKTELDPTNPMWAFYDTQLQKAMSDYSALV
jgi:hypothetical protein